MANLIPTETLPANITSVDREVSVSVSIPPVDLHDVIADALEPALRAGTAVLESELRLRIPEGPRGPNYNLEFEPLKDTLVSGYEVDKSALTGTSSTGFGKSGSVALWVEYGHQEVVPSQNGSRYRSPSGKSRAGELVGQVPEHPFMRPAFDACADKVIDAVADSIVDSILKAYGG
jgi:hypothetical protein